MTEVTGSSIILKYKEYFVFEIQKKHKWITFDGNKVKLGISCIGGKVEGNEKPLETLHREAKEEISVDVSIEPIEKPFIVNPGYDVEWLDSNENENAFFYWYGYKGYRICTYYGQALQHPKPKDLAGVLLIDFETLVKAFRNNATVGELAKMGAVIIEKDNIPRDAYIFPVNTVEVLCKLYENGEKLIHWALK